jgi:hypothetical protein
MADAPTPFENPVRQESSLSAVVMSSSDHPAGQTSERVWVGGVVGGRRLGPLQRLMVGLLAIIVVTLMVVVIVPLGLIAVLIFLALTAIAIIRGAVAEFVGRLTGTRDRDAPARHNVRVRAPARSNGPGEQA